MHNFILSVYPVNELIFDFKHILFLTAELVPKILSKIKSIWLFHVIYHIFWDALGWYYSKLIISSWKKSLMLIKPVFDRNTVKK